MTLMMEFESRKNEQVIEGRQNYGAFQNDDRTISLLNRAATNGFKVLVVTLDTWTLAWRPADLDNGKKGYCSPFDSGLTSFSLPTLLKRHRKSDRLFRPCVLREIQKQTRSQSLRTSHWNLRNGYLMCSQARLLVGTGSPCSRNTGKVPSC